MSHNNNQRNETLSKWTKSSKSFSLEKKHPTFKTDSYQICYQSYQLSSFVDNLQLHHSIPTPAPITTEMVEVQIVTVSLW